MPEENLRDQIKDMMINDLNLRVTKDEITDDRPLFGPDGLGLDSIDALQLAVSLEKAYGVKLPNSEVARGVLVNVNTMHDFVVANRAA